MKKPLVKTLKGIAKVMPLALLGVASSVGASPLAERGRSATVGDATMSSIMFVLLAGLAFGPVTVQNTNVETLIDFRSETASDWYAVNDDVMGGRSSSSMRRTSDGVALFEGNVSLENNGGFASVRTEVAVGTLEGFSRLVLRVRGDGKRYQVRLRMSTAFDGIAYAADFETIADDWTVVEIPLRSFRPSFRGYRPRNAEPLDPAKVRQIGIMLTDKQEGPFRLEIQWIGAAPDQGRR